jgi:hypothetical protein
MLTGSCVNEVLQIRAAMAPPFAAAQALDRGGPNTGVRA